MEAPVIVNPEMADVVIGNIQTGLKEKLPWLDVAFGRAERIVKQIGGKTFYLPAIYTGDTLNPNEYIELSPDSQLGSFSFFWMLDPQRVTWIPKVPGVVRAPFALIFWFDLRKVYKTRENRNVSSLEAEVLQALNGGFKLSTGSVRVDRIYHTAESIYREFTLSAVDNQFLMHPYAGFRLEGEIVFEESCYSDTVIIPSWYNTSDADVTPADVVQGVVAYGANGRIVGTLTFAYDEIYNRLIQI